MIPVEYYSNVYYFLLSVTILFGIFPIFFNKEIENFPKINLYVGVILILAITIFFIGLRNPYGDFKYFGDTLTYTTIYEDLKNISIDKKSDFGFYFFMKLCSKYVSVSFFYFLCALLYVVPLYLALKKWFDKYVYFAFILYVSSMSFWAFGINGVRNGIATSLFVYGLSMDRKVLKFAIFFISFTFHSSIILPFLAYLISLYYSKTSFLIKIWIAVVVLSFFLGDQLELYITTIFSNLNITNDQRIDTYFSDELDGEFIDRKYRFDFIVYSSVAIIFGYVYTIKKNFNSIFYKQLLNTYIISNTVWVIMIYAAYTNRTAYLSWFIMPIVLIYPLLKEKMFVAQNKIIGYMILASLLFTLIIFTKTA